MKMKEKELKMIREVRKNDKTSFLVGTAHFFPYSFRSSLIRYMKNARTVIFEGPLDQENMDRVVKAGTVEANAPHIFDALDRQTTARIVKALVLPASIRIPSFFHLLATDAEKTVYDMVKGMKPWMAFFTIWSSFLEKKGWRNSVDLEAYRIAKELDRNIVFLETIEEQIKVLENLSYEKIIGFLKRIDQWNDYAHSYMKYYLNGDLEKIISMGTRIPSRNYQAIDRRDKIFFERMIGYFEEGNAIAFVGAPHVVGISGMFRERGYEMAKMS